MIVGGHSVLRLESQPVFGSFGVQLNEVSNAPSWVVQLQIRIKVDVGLGLKNSLDGKDSFLCYSEEWLSMLKNSLRVAADIKLASYNRLIRQCTKVNLSWKAKGPYKKSIPLVLANFSPASSKNATTFDQSVIWTRLAAIMTS